MTGPEQCQSGFPVPKIGRASRLTRAVAALVFSFSLFQPWSGVGLAEAQEANYQVRSFSAGPAWFVYEGEIDAALYVPKPDAPKCHEIGEIILLFENRDQLLDEALINDAALAAMSHYAALCDSLGARGSNQRKVVGLVTNEGEPDEGGRVLGDLRVFEATVTTLGATAGQYKVVVRRNVAVQSQQQTAQAAAHKAERDQQMAQLREEQTEAQARKDETRRAEIADVRATYDPALEQSLETAKPAGLVGRLVGGNRAALTGAWSGSAAQCEKELVILFELDGTGTVEWWRNDRDAYGLLPWRTGRWELRDDTVIMTFDHRVEYSSLLGKVQSGPINETAQFDLVKADSEELRLAATGGGLSPGLLFLGGDEKLFVRCGK